MSIGRRLFLKSGAIATLTAGAFLGLAKSIFGQNPVRRNISTVLKQVPSINQGEYSLPLTAIETPVFSFTSDTFQPYVGDVFTVPNPLGHIIPLRLTSVTDYRVRPATRIAVKKAQQPKSFSLIFTSNQQLPRFTSIHKMTHPALGEFELFLTSREVDGLFFHEAVINNLR